MKTTFKQKSASKARLEARISRQVHSTIRRATEIQGRTVTDFVVRAAPEATPKAAVAKFAAAGRSATKKDLGLISMTYGSAYVASVAMGARDEHTLRAFIEAEAYDGPSIIIAYSHCIAHGFDLSSGLEHQKAAVDSGHWLLYRYNPERLKEGLNPLQLDSKKPKMPVEQFLNMENRFRMLKKTHPGLAKQYFEAIQKEVDARWSHYEHLASMSFDSGK